MFLKYVTAIFLLFFSAFMVNASDKGSLILLVDVSASIHASGDLPIQMNGYAETLEQVAALNGVHVEVILFAETPLSISSGTSIDAAAAFREFNYTISQVGILTCISHSLDSVIELLPTLSRPITLDISGDGEANCNETDLNSKLNFLEANGVVINTLLVSTDETTIDFYERLSRNDGFSMVIEDFFDFEDAIYRKVSLELSMMQQ